MKNCSLIILLFAVSFTISAQSQRFAAAKSGLNMRESPDMNAPVITKIPYGEKITQLHTKHIGTFTTEGMESEWLYVSYGKYEGFVADMYTLPFAPPNHKDIEEYLNSISTPIAKWEIKPPFESDGVVNDENVQTLKILYNNGMVYRINQGYEWHNITLWLPSITMEKTFVLARLLPSFETVISTSYPFPKQSHKLSNEMTVDVSQSVSWPFTKTIRYEFNNGAFSTVEIRNEDGEISLTFSSGI